MFDFLMDVLFPGKCISCGKKTVGGEHHFLCGHCATSFRVLSDDRASGGACFRCGAETYAAHTGQCYRCSGTQNHFRTNTSILSYRDPALRDLFRRFKFGSNRLAGKDLSLLLRRHLNSFIGNGNYDTVAVTPVSGRTLRKRGYNQVGNILEMCGIPFSSILERTGQKNHQSELSADDREFAVRGQFRLSRQYSNSISGKKILLVDDVYTTGNTANEISRVLLEAGADGVDVLTFFRD